MESSVSPVECRLCNTPLQVADLQHRLCPVCDDYAQHIALQSNRALDRIVGELQNGPMFRNASRRVH